MSTEDKKTNTGVAKTTNTGVSKVKASPAERFTNKVMSLFPSGGDQKIQLTTLQRKLINNYFIKLDGVLTESEVKRLAKPEKYRDSLPYSWENVNMNKLAQDVVAFSEIGLDPLQANHINPIPYKNKKTNKFDITFIPGYNGIEIKAKRYGLDAPDKAIIELVFSTDEFKQIKKDAENDVENYLFNVTDEFDRGELKGGFYYHIYNNDPTKNKLVVMNVKDIEKRKPTYAAPEFWGGSRDKWENGQKVGKEKVEGWYLEMCWKTVKRACWNEINIDPEKIDEHLQRVLLNESENVTQKVGQEIDNNANGDVIDMDFEEVNEKKSIEAPNTESKPTKTNSGKQPEMKF